MQCQAEKHLQLLQVHATPAPKILLLDEFDAVTEKGHAMRRSAADGEECREHRQPSRAGWHKLLDCEILDNVVVALVTNRPEAELAHIFGPAFLRSMRALGHERSGALRELAPEELAPRSSTPGLVQQ